MASVRLSLLLLVGAAASTMAAPRTGGENAIGIAEQTVEMILGRFYLVQVFSKDEGLELKNCLYIDTSKNAMRPDSICVSITVNDQQMEPYCEDFNPEENGGLLDAEGNGVLDANGEFLTIKDDRTISVFSRAPVPVPDNWLDLLPGLQSVKEQYPETAIIDPSVCAS